MRPSLALVLRRGRGALAALSLAALAAPLGCASSRPPPPPPLAPAPLALALPAPPAPAAPVVPDGPFAAPPPVHTPLPLSIARLVAEQQDEMGDVRSLAAPVGDARGRARAAAEVSALADELREIETGLRAGTVDSDRLDALVTRLQLLQTRLALLHDALRVASGPASAVQSDLP